MAEEEAKVGTRFVMPSSIGYGCYEVWSIDNGHANAQCKGIVQTDEEVRIWMKGRWPEKMVLMVHPELNGHAKHKDTRPA